MFSPLRALRQVNSAIARRGEIAQMAALNCCNRFENERKNFLFRYLDLFYSQLRWEELSSRYYAQGMDLKGRRISRDFLSYSQFRRLRDRRNGTGAFSRGYSYACLLQDKLLFERYFSANGIPVEKSVWCIGAGRDEQSGLTEETLLAEMSERLADGECYFLKPRFGIKGSGVYKLQRFGREFAINGTPASPEDLKKIASVPYLVQQLVDQHPVAARFHPESLNTFRIITYRTDGRIEVFLAYLRMAAGGEIADNSVSSRAVVRVNEKTGQLYPEGYTIKGEEAHPVKAHPDSGIAFSDVVIPRMEDCVALVRYAHEWLPGMHSIGWDVALTREGPVLLEGNEDWGATLAMWIESDFSNKFKKMISS